MTSNHDSRRVPVKSLDRHPGPYPYYGASGVVDHVDDYLFEGEFLLVAEDGENLRTRTTPIAFRASGRFWVNNHAHVLTGSDGNDTRFLTYAIQQSDIAGFITGSTQPKLSQGSLSRIPLLLPPADSQRAIAELLGSLDDRIEVNRRMSETLEQIARTLFRSWFVDFDPVRGTATVPEDIRRLFPDRLVTSLIGPVPDGWDIQTLGDMVANVNDLIDPRELPPETPYIGLEHMPRGRIALEAWGTPAGLASAKKRFRAGEILFGKLRPYFRKVGVAPIDGICSTDILVLRARDPSQRALALMVAASDAFIDRADAASTGTRMPRAAWNDMSAFPVVVPPRPLCRAFAEVVDPMLSRIVAGIRESRTLAELRDALLPKLLSGELRVDPSAVQSSSSDGSSSPGRMVAKSSSTSSP